MTTQLALIEEEHKQVASVAAGNPAFAKVLREYQELCLSEVRRHIREGRKNVMLCAPTGSGKTLIASYIIFETVRNLKRANFVVDRINLVDQTGSVFYEMGIHFGVQQANHPNFKPWERAQIVSAQTMARRGADKWPESAVDVIDEAHTLSEVVKARIAPRERITLGLSATPFTKGLGIYFDALVNVTTTNKLIEDGFLSRYRIFAASEPDMKGVKVVAGEWAEKESSKRAMVIVGDAVSEYLKHGDGGKFICRGVDVDHVTELHKQFMAAGVMCATYTYKDKDTDRSEVVKEFRKPDSFYRGIITVSAATKGFDVPDIRVVIDCRPLRKSLAEVIQFLGRGFRISPETGKTECIVLDHSGNMRRFWNEIMEFFQTGATELDDGTKKPKEKKSDKTEEKSRKCPKCHHLHAMMPFCPHCGYEYPKLTLAVQHKQGTLAELIASGDKKRMNENLWPQVVAYAHEKRGTDKVAESYALGIYKGLTGDFPKNTFGATTPAAFVTDEVRGKIKSRMIAFAKAQQKAAKAAL